MHQIMFLGGRVKTRKGSERLGKGRKEKGGSCQELKLGGKTSAQDVGDETRLALNSQEEGRNQTESQPFRRKRKKNVGQRPAPGGQAESNN